MSGSDRPSSNECGDHCSKHWVCAEIGKATALMIFSDAMSERVIRNHMFGHWREWYDKNQGEKILGKYVPSRNLWRLADQIIEREVPSREYL